MPTVSTPTGTLSYEVHGTDDPPILWIGGTGCPGATWAAQVARFAPAHRCIVYDLPGAGESAVPEPGSCTPRTLAADALHLLDELAVSRAHCAGFSLGAATVQELALLAPERVSSAVLLGTWASSRTARHITQHFEARRRALREASRELFAAFGFWIWSASLRDREPERAARLAASFGELAAGVSTAGYLAHFDADLAHDCGERLAEIACPTLVLFGSEDFVTLPAYNREVAALIPGAEACEIAGGGHMVWYERPDEVADAIEAFLARRAANP